MKCVTLEMGSVYVSPDLPVGGVVASKRFPVRTQTEYVAFCDNGGTIRREVLQGAPLSGFSNVYSTGVKGIGIRYGSGNANTFSYYPNTNRYSTDVYVQFLAGSYFSVELIKTEAATGSGALTTGVYSKTLDDFGQVLTTVFLPANGITIVTPSCTVDAGSRNIAVQLGKVARNSFNGVGSTASARPFSIQLNCSAGVGTTNTVYLKMDATPDPSGQQGVLQVTQGAEAASGVGIQVLDKTNVGIKFGEDALVGPSKEGSYVLPYTARYIQTAPNVTVGPANGVATFTLNYK